MTDRTAPAVRAVFFDAGGTLLTAQPSVGEVYAEVLASFGRSLDPGRLEREFRRAWQRATDGAATGTDRYAAAGSSSAFWRELLDRTLLEAGGDSPLSERELAAVRLEFTRPHRYHVYPDVRPTLDALALRGVVLGVISNWDEGLPEVLRSLGLFSCFQVHAVSGIEGVEKPAAEIFHRACARAGVAPGEAIHVGDSVTDDLDGARAAGLQGVLLDRDGADRSAGVVSELGAIVALLDAERPRV